MTRVEQTKRDLLHLETGTQRLTYERGDEAEVSELGYILTKSFLTVSFFFLNPKRLENFSLAPTFISQSM